ncbi:MAG: hypothetical protein CUN48_09860 [Candidatus Thermofonsia Clade 3 bacterium]|jgi:hypothetical protein|uniref:ParB/Sulfiredoxin domain-containing protein n=1 Tax=Candidatus Thermofonsia Clade 3 bacterium TaxID=2364212 RepID=A0A2M8QBP3_9CHLR|nr:hypothetical protein [Candidatus Roseilinea sp. NK_OTU-006]PJF47218.1 MAG: hypothetical protein CUN48_09860 [Candidatus Thermofonsia Clade 3 bacterium]
MQLPDLRILPLDLLIPHERTDPRRVNPLLARIRDEAVLRNPPIVAPFGNGDKQFVVLDGANRITAMRTLGVPHALVQVVDYSQVQLFVWHHAITQCSVEALLAQIRGIPGLRIYEGDLTHARAMLARREALAFISCDHTHKTDILCGGGDVRERTALLNQLVDMYEGCAKVQRTISDNLREVRQSFSDASAVVVFPRYEPAEIIELARIGVMLPAGITRHVLPLRALRVNYPMAILRSDMSLAQKQGHLSEWLHECLMNRRVRTYTEPTVLFDE